MALALTPTPSWRPKGVFDWLFALWVVACAAVAFWQYRSAMDVYEQGILIGSVPVAIAMGWFWRPLAHLMLGVAALSLVGIGLYQGPEGADLARAEQVFWLKYFLSSQSAILWMSVLVFMSTVFYWLGMVLPRADSASLLGARLAWAAAQHPAAVAGAHAAARDGTGRPPPAVMKAAPAAKWAKTSAAG
ncbi:MAG: hypothetical protein ACO3IP_07345, partial [Burkholderiaceae bacterium]